jgi:hypothetical protein
MINDPRLFRHRTRGAGRPQVVLCGNGLERAEGQPGWGELLNALRAPGVPELADGDPRWDLPFPLLYQLLSTPVPAPPTLSRDDVEAEERRLRDGLSRLSSGRVALLDALPGLRADHVLTTNYTYCLERSFLPVDAGAGGRAVEDTLQRVMPEVQADVVRAGLDSAQGEVRHPDRGHLHRVRRPHRPHGRGRVRRTNRFRSDGCVREGASLGSTVGRACVSSPAQQAVVTSP